MKQILCLSYTPWQTRPNRTQQILTRMTDTQVLFFEPPLQAGAAKPEQGRKMRKHITVYTLPQPRTSLLSLLLRRQQNQTAVADFVQAAMDHNGFREPVLWCTRPDQSVLLDQIAYRGLVYDCHREWNADYLEQESDLASHAEVVFAASPGLARRLAPCSDNIALIPNGVNPLMFFRREFAPPDDLAALAGQPVFGHVGDLSANVDLSPLLAAAHARPDWTFLMIGRVTKRIAEQLSAYRNVILTGAVNAIELPDYLSVCSVLFDLIREDTRGCDIISSRIYEYLATGKPIVAMIEPEQPEPFPDMVYTAYNDTGFVRRCESALQEPPGAKFAHRQNYAHHSSWEARAEEVSKVFERAGLF